MCTARGTWAFLGHIVVVVYDKVQQQVTNGGEVGQLFDTYLGTKQCSELSPWLFDLFIDVLPHDELILMEVPGAGPVVGNLQALLDIIYADDVALIADTLAMCGLSNFWTAWMCVLCHFQHASESARV
jgi:hypothetical protein